MITNKEIRVVVADDHPYTVEHLREKLAARIPNLKIVADVRRGLDLEQVIVKHRPDLLILDLEMEQGFDAAQAIAVLRERHPALKIVIFSAHNDPWIVLEMLRMKADGFAFKGEPFTELIKCVESVREDQTWYSLGLMHNVAKLLRQDTTQSLLGEQSTVLRERERLVLQYVADFLTTEEIADRIAVSERTIQADIASAMRKLNAPSRLGAVVKALREGLIK
jgi:DNA-binding NarL/FixJ family response regulator